MTDKDIERLAKVLAPMLAEQMQKQTAEPEVESLLDLREASEFLSVSPSTIRLHIGEIPHAQKKPKSKIYFKKHDLLNWINTAL